MTRRLLNNGRGPDGAPLSLVVDDGNVADVSPTPFTAVGDDEGVDLDGRLLLPAPVEPHVHLDKVFLAESVPNPTGDLIGAIDAMERSAELRTGADTARRAERAVRRLIDNGYAAVRSHVDVTTGDGLESLEALIDLRGSYAPRIDIELVALPGIGFSSRGAEYDLLCDAVDVGADLVGGCPHLEPDQRAATDLLLELATDRGRGVDLHTDESLDPAADGLRLLSDAVDAGFALPVTASHCVSLGQQPPERQHETAARVAAAGIGVVTLPLTNLFLQGRGAHPMPRGLTAVDTLREHGVVVAAGADNVQDPFNPVGRLSAFETAAMLVVAAHQLPELAWRAVSSDAARLLGRRPSGLAVGDRAELIAVEVDSVREAIAEQPAVWRVPTR